MVELIYLNRFLDIGLWLKGNINVLLIVLLFDQHVAVEVEVGCLGVCFYL